MNINKIYKMATIDSSISNVYSGDIIEMLKILRELKYTLIDTNSKGIYLIAIKKDSIAIITNDSKDKKIINIASELYDKSIFEKEQMKNDFRKVKLKSGMTVMIDKDDNLVKITSRQKSMKIEEEYEEILVQLTYTYARDYMKKEMTEYVAKHEKEKNEN